MSISTPTQITVPFGTGGLKNTIPATANPTTGNAGYSGGFPAINMTPKVAGGIPPFGEDFNGIFFDVTTAIQYLEAGGTFPYNSGFSTAVGGYPIGAIVSRQNRDGIWVNLVANNTTNPDSGGTGWQPIGDSGIVGATRNLKMIISTASASAAITADQVVVRTNLDGVGYCLSSFNQTINLATTGAGGMDVGAAPVNGYVAVYAIYNPLTGARSLLATNATSIAAAEVYAGANMPAGYTASSLVSIRPTNATSQFTAGAQRDRIVIFVPLNALSTSTPQASPTLISISSFIPLNAVRINGTISVGATGAASLNMSIQPDIIGSGQASISINAAATGSNPATRSPYSIVIITPQTIYWAGANGNSFNITISQYEF